MVECECRAVHERKRVVLTGGPGAGKTALLELLRQSFCEHVRVLPEAASTTPRSFARIVDDNQVGAARCRVATFGPA